MKTTAVRLHRLHIPLRLALAHGKASRLACDSIIVELETDRGTGWGEIVLRDYVGGRLAGDGDALEAAASSLAAMAGPIAGREMSWPAFRAFLEALAVRPEELPILCGLEGALLYAGCIAEGKDIYGLLGTAPAREEIRYGGTLPLLPEEAARQVLALFASLELPWVRVKAGPDAARTGATLEVVRRVLGADREVAVDANACWAFTDALAHLPVLRRAGVRVVEEPFGRGRPESGLLARHPDAAGMSIMADESVLTVDDARSICSAGAFTRLNIRLAKNGGILRALAIAAEARAAGIPFQLGCHIGETGILSALGRAAAALLSDARVVDGSADALILSGNVVVEDLTFGRGGRAAVITGRGVGCTVDPGALRRYSDGSRLCL